MNEFCDQLYSTYLQLYEAFKSQHKASLRNNHISPAAYASHVKVNEAISKDPMSAPVLTELTAENFDATERQKKIVKLLINLSTTTPGTLLNQYSALTNPDASPKNITAVTSFDAVSSKSLSNSAHSDDSAE